MPTDPTFTVFQQATTGKLHRREACSVTSRTRYNHFRRELKAADIAQLPRCEKCWSEHAGMTWDAQPDDGRARHADPKLDALYAARREAAENADNPGQYGAGWAKLEAIEAELRERDPDGDWYYEGNAWDGLGWQVRRPANPITRRTPLRSYPGWTVREYANGTLDAEHIDGALTIGAESFDEAVALVADASYAARKEL